MYRLKTGPTDTSHCRWSWIGILGLTVCLFSAHAAAIDNSLSENAALGLFYSRNLELISAAYGLETAQAQRIIASAIPNPELVLYSQEIAPRYPDASIGPALYVTVSQLIETAGKRRLRMESSAVGARAAESELRDAARILSQALRHAFYRLLLAQKGQSMAEEQYRHVQQLVEVNQQRFDVGDISERDLARIKVEASKVQSDLDRAVANRGRANAELAVLLAWPQNAEQLVAEDRWPDGSIFERLHDAGSAGREAIDRRPDVESSRLRKAQADKEFELAKAHAIPDVTFNAGFGHDWGNIVTNAATLGLSVPLPIYYRNEGQVAQAGIHRNDAEVQIRRVENNVRAEVITALAAWRAADAVVKRFKQEILQKAKYIRDTAEVAYSQGDTDIVDLIQAQRDYRTALSDYFQSEADRAFAYADLKMALAMETMEFEITPTSTP